MIRDLGKGIVVVVFLFVSVALNAQSGEAYGGYSPYSVFGLGDIAKEGTAFNKSMGGIGIAARNRRFMNLMNPAAVTARDSLSFMADFGLAQKNTVFTQRIGDGRLRSAANTFNISNLALSFPIYRSSAFMVGITPFSDLGYDFSRKETSEDVVGNVGNITHEHYGEGSVYQLFLGVGATFWRRFSVGVQGIYYFGTLDKVYNMDFENSSYRSINSGNILHVQAFTGKFGLQYDQPLGQNMHLTVGATYRMGTKMKGSNTSYVYANQSSVTDTVSYSVNSNASKLRIGDEIGVGIALRSGDMWSVEFDYLRSSWKGTNIDSVEGFANDGFTASVSQSFRAGFEIVPNRNDIRYYLRTCAYRAGVYYDQAYYMFNGNRVDTYGITLGVTLPVFRLYNGLSVGVDFGQRGSLMGGMVRERFANIVIGFNIHDLWFHKQRYE